MNDIIYDIAFSLDESITPIEKRILFENFNSSKKIFELGKSTIKNILGRRWSGNRFLPENFINIATNLYQFIIKSGIKIARYYEKEYPLFLKEIPDHPFLIYYKGNIEYNPEKSIAIVGTRNPDQRGILNTKRFTKRLVEEGFTIISGLAKGIDVEAHKEALKNKGKTIAVLGCGIDRIYPAEHKEIAREILDNNGGIISEYAPGIQARKWYFPKRNRIIVGLSNSVLIVQSPKRSGSLISAFLAADYSRDLFVVSPQIGNPKEEGNDMLIKTGGREVKDPEEIIKSL
ncbi:MAG TPA: DNA-processing protein DprA [Spirochaetota bacterium]|nr:DNA-processing protein DprA [Spirochaetota bacterium]HOL56215.1 DNA-processing protein DprA [Spirochaetota bacterium]HPP03832.1 DNA-processing protein DprA [Spirochaetota bacterium]